ncbi:MAG: hypothetical protein ABW219_11600 [Ilumatobacteraceae bacterium]
MPGNVLRYDPERVAALEVRARSAIERLAAVTSDDPAAAGAVATASRARRRLEADWLPLLSAVVASDAMVTWNPTGPAALGGAIGGSGMLALLFPSFLGRSGADLGEAMAETARAVIDEGDVDDVVGLTEALRAASGDVVAIRTFFDDLGGSGSADLLMALGAQGGHPDEAVQLATVVRSVLAADSLRAGFPPGFAPALVATLVEARDETRRSPAAALAFLFDDTTFGTAMLADTTTALVEQELIVAGGRPEEGAAMWPGLRVGSVLHRALDEEADRDGTSEAYRAADPMYALLEGLARDGDAARAVFTDDTVATYLFGQRAMQEDGMRRLAAAAERAAAGPDVVAGADPQLLEDAGLVASAFVNHLASRHPDVLWTYADNADVSRSIATILGQHMLAVQTSVLVGDQDSTPPRQEEVPGALVDVFDEARGDGVSVRVASFDEHALGVATDLAVDSTDGLAIVRAALDIHVQTEATLAIGRVAVGDLPPGRDPNLFLAEAMQDAARMEAHFVAHAGHRAEERGRSVDQLIGAWIGLASLSIGKANSQYKTHGGASARLSAPVIGDLLGPAADLATSLLATHQAAAARSAEANAEAATDQLVYLWCREAYRQGVIVPDLPAGVVVGGELVEWDAFLELPPSVRQETLNHLEETTGLDGINLDGNGIRDAIKTEQLASYQTLD